MKLNLEYLVEALWGHLNMVRIYTKKPGCPPDFSDPIILRNGANVKHVCHTIHRTLPDVFKYALVWVNTKKLFLYQKTQINRIVKDVFTNVKEVPNKILLSTKMYLNQCPYLIFSWLLLG